MKFLGIDTEIMGNTEACLFILHCLERLEKKLKIYLNPIYLNKFYFIVTINHDIINVIFDNIEINDNQKQLKICLSTQNALSNEQIYQLYASYIKDHLHELNTVSEAKQYVENNLDNTVITDLKNIIDNYGIFLFNSYKETLDLSNNQDYSSDDSSDEAIYGVDDSESLDVSQTNNEINNIDISTLNDDETIVYNIDDSEQIVTSGNLSEILSNNLDNEDVEEKLKNFIVTCVMKGNQMIKINILSKELVVDGQNTQHFNKEKLKLLGSFFINNHLVVSENRKIKSQIKSRHLSETNWNYEGDENFTSIKDQDGTYDINYYEKNDTYLEFLIYNKNGFYFNEDDIAFTLKLNYIILSSVNNPQVFSDDTSKFYLEKYSNKYKYNYKYHRDQDKIFNSYLNNTKLMCDVCGETLPKTKQFYTSINTGDCCKKCYNYKLSIKQLRIKHFKEKIRLVGRREVFKKDVKKMREFLTYLEPVKLSSKKKLLIRNKTIQDYNETNIQGICKICLDVLHFTPKKNEPILNKHPLFELNKGNTNISVGSLCGHAFHTTCLQELTSHNCPYCRTDTKFTRLFF
jgi:hypothetical protein